MGKYKTFRNHLKEELKNPEFKKVYEKEDFIIRVAIQIAQERQRHHLTQKELAKKLHTSRRDAFKAVNGMAIAKVDYNNKKIEYIHHHADPVPGKMVVREKFEEKVAIIKTYPNMFFHFIDTAIAKGYKGIILEGSGIGQAPTNIKEDIPIYNALQKFIKKGGIVVLTSNCIFGEVHPYIYKNCRRLEEIGVIFGKDMLTETAFIKLAWLLGNYTKKDATQLMTENLRGEIGTRQLYQHINLTD